MSAKRRYTVVKTFKGSACSKNIANIFVTIIDKMNYSGIKCLYDEKDLRF